MITNLLNGFILLEFGRKFIVMAERFSQDGKEKSLWKRFGKAALITIAAVVGIGVVINAIK